MRTRIAAEMSNPGPQPAAPQGTPPWFQFSLRTLLLLFVVLASSLGVFGAWGIVAFALVVGLAISIRFGESQWTLFLVALVLFVLMHLWIPVNLPASRAFARRAE